MSDIPEIAAQCVVCMVINRLSVLVSGLGVVSVSSIQHQWWFQVVSGRFRRSAVSLHDSNGERAACKKMVLPPMATDAFGEFISAPFPDS